VLVCGQSDFGGRNLLQSDREYLNIVIPCMQAAGPVVARSKAWVCISSTADIAGSNPNGGTEVCLL
jgi:hypothetical protein